MFQKDQNNQEGIKDNIDIKIDKKDIINSTDTNGKRLFAYAKDIGKGSNKSYDMAVNSSKGCLNEKGLNTIKKEIRHKKNSIRFGITIPINRTSSSNKFISAVIENKVKDKNRRNSDYPYMRKDNWMTYAERTMYKFLVDNLGDKVTIFCKVRIADIIDVDDSISKDAQNLYKITSKCVNYLICSKKTLDMICAVELEECKNISSDMVARNAFVSKVFECAGIPLIGINTPVNKLSLSDIEGIKREIRVYMAPKCPVCGLKMRLNTSSSEHNLYECTNYPKCNTIIKEGD